MTTTAQARALLLTGPHGAGKSALVAEIAGLLEGRVPFAAIDLDWLAWYDDGVTPGHSLAAFEMLARNLVAIVTNYREAAIGHFPLAGAILDHTSHESLVEAMGMPIRVVRITAPVAEIERRLQAGPGGAIPLAPTTFNHPGASAPTSGYAARRASTNYCTPSITMVGGVRSDPSGRAMTT